VDLPNANVAWVTEQLVEAFDINPDEIILASAKTGKGISDLFSAVVQ